MCCRIRQFLPCGLLALSLFFIAGRAAQADEEPYPEVPAVELKREVRALPLGGPYPTLKDATERLTHGEQTADSVSELLFTPPAGSAILEVRLLHAKRGDRAMSRRDYSVYHALGLKTARGWFLLQNYVEDGVNGDVSYGADKPPVCRLEPATKVGDGKLVRCELMTSIVDVLRFCEGGQRGDGSRLEKTRGETVLFCGVGPSNVPSCTPKLTLVYAYSRPSCAETKAKRETWAYAASITSDGLMLAPLPGKKQDRAPPALVHSLRFP